MSKLGKLGNAFGNVGDKIFGTKEDRKRRVELEKQIKLEERDAYNDAYRKARIKRARKEGSQRGSKSGSGLGSLARYGESFAKAGEDMLSLPTSHRRSQSHARTRTVYVKKKIPVKSRRKQNNSYDFW